MSTNGAEIYHKVAQMAAELEFADFGCARIGELPTIRQEQYMEALQQGRFARMEYLTRNIDKRFNPSLLVDGARTILVFLAPYALPAGIAAPKGIAQFALGKDYHIVIKEKLFSIMKMMYELDPDFQGRAFTDSAPVMERYWAVEAGLGWIGKNNFLINKQCGIKNLIGVIICNLDIPATAEILPGKHQQSTGSCGECRRCIDACPSGALVRPFCTDARKCISYHTIENRHLAEDMTNGAVPDFTESLFGCDRCLDACPWNSVNKEGWMEFHKNIEILQGIEPDRWESLSKEEFKNIFKDTSLMRGGLDNIKAALEWGKKRGQNG